MRPVLPLPPASRNQALPGVGCMAGATQNHGEGTVAASEPTAAVSRGGASKSSASDTLARRFPLEGGDCSPSQRRLSSCGSVF